MARARLRIVIGTALALGAIVVLRPWTVRPLQTEAPATFDAVAYVAEAWPRVLSEAQRTAIPVQDARAATPAQPGAGAPSSRRPVFVTVTGVVTDVDRHSRVGVAHMRAGTGTPVNIAIQIGPVIRGTALRDAVPFFSFTDFANQTDFAAVSNELNTLVLRHVLGGLNLDALPGRSLTVTGAATFPSAGNGGPIDLVPVVLHVDGGGR